MKENSMVVIEALKSATIALEKQDQQSAIQSLEKITNEVANFKKAAERYEKEAKGIQTATVAQVSELIKKQGKAHADCDQAKKELSKVYEEVASKKVSIQDLNKRIGDHNNSLQGYNNELRRLNDRNRDLHNKSAGSIILSILCLGLDRAVKAILIDIDGVNAKIKSTNKTIESFTGELTKLKSLLDEDNNRANTLNIAVEQKNKLIKELDFLEFKLHNQEYIIRKRVVFFTEVNLFYLKLQNLLDNISNRIGDVCDIVKELNNETPTIASFDPSQRDLISLSDAIVLFGKTIEKNTPIASFDPVFDENRWYSLSTEWLGTTKSLGVIPDGSNIKLIMTKNENKPDQLWKIKSIGNGYFRLTNQLYGEKKSMDNIFLADSGNFTGQYWKLEPEFGFFRLTTKWLGENKSLDIVNDETRNKLIMADSGNYAGQQWRFIGQ